MALTETPKPRTGTSRGPSKVPPQCPRPLPHVPRLNRGPPAPLPWSQHAPDSPLSRCTSGPYHLYRYAGKKGQRRVPAGTKPGVQALGVVQRPRARLRTSKDSKPPEAPPPHPKRPSCHYRKTVSCIRSLLDSSFISHHCTWPGTVCNCGIRGSPNFVRISFQDFPR